MTSQNNTVISGMVQNKLVVGYTVIVYKLGNTKHRLKQYTKTPIKTRNRKNHEAEKSCR